MGARLTNGKQICAGGEENKDSCEGDSGDSIDFKIWSILTNEIDMHCHISSEILLICHMTGVKVLRTVLPVMYAFFVHSIAIVRYTIVYNQSNRTAMNL